MAEPVHVQFTKIQEAIDSENWDTVISIADKILKTTPEDKNALACKIAALIKNDQYSEALKEIKSAKDSSSFLFEHAYALYKEKNVKALELLEGANVNEQKYFILKAQIYYILEKFVEASKVYQDMEEPFGFHSDLLCNLVATYVRSEDYSNVNSLFERYKGIMNTSFEGMYNIGTAFLESGDLMKAREFLELAKSICESSLTGLDQDVIDSEVGIIRAQLAYIEQRKGESALALKMYEDIFESKAGLAVKAVCSNNIVTLREGDKFDSLRKLQKLKNDAVQSRLAPMQLQIIGFNHCLLLLSMNKADECRTLLESLQSQYPKNGLYPILASAMLQKEKKIPESQAILNSFIENNPESTANSSLVLAQMNLNQGELMKAYKILSGIEKFMNKPAMVCTLVSLLKQLGDIDGAVSLLDQTVMALSEKDIYYIPILRGNADFKYENGRFSEAAIAYKRLLSLDKGNQEITILLAMSYSYCDVEKAKETEKLLAPLPGTLDINAEELENLPMIVPTYVPSKTDKDLLVEKEAEKKIKKKKKKKNKAPKNLNPMATPDPDRWKPKHLRHGYRGKKRGKIPNSRGVQGSATVSQAQQLSDAGLKGATQLKNTQQAQPQQQPIDKGQPTEAQRKAQAAAQAATQSKGGARGGKGGKGGNRKK